MVSEFRGEGYPGRDTGAEAGRSKTTHLPYIISGQESPGWISIFKLTFFFENIPKPKFFW